MAHINLTIPIITLMRIERDCQTGLKKKKSNQCSVQEALLRWKDTNSLKVKE